MTVFLNHKRIHLKQVYHQKNRKHNNMSAWERHQIVLSCCVCEVWTLLLFPHNMREMQEEVMKSGWTLAPWQREAEMQPAGWMWSCTCLPLMLEAETTRWVTEDKSLRLRTRTWGGWRTVKSNQQKLGRTGHGPFRRLYLVWRQELSSHGQIHCTHTGVKKTFTV